MFLFLIIYFLLLNQNREISYVVLHEILEQISAPPTWKGLDFFLLFILEK